ncbi:MAG: hypothetical protein JW719_04045 [Pirellulales bacterium]|nr:hypothetical protein [Pirellulales bacterium]
MTLSFGDWAIIVVYLIGCMGAGIWMRRYVKNVEDFAVAGREMDVYLGIASLAATEMGLVTVMYTAELGFTNGPAGATIGVLMAGAMLLVGLTGFVIKPMRDAGVITIPELFEKRFGPRVRWLAGLVIVLGGVLNMGIFLQLGGKFLVSVSGINAEYLKWTMTALLGLVLLYTVLGGMLSVLVTDYLQFLILGLGLVVTSVLVIWSVNPSTGAIAFNWPNIVTGLQQAHVSGEAYREEAASQAQKERETIAAARATEDPEAAESLRTRLVTQAGDELSARRKQLAEKDVLVVVETEPRPGEERTRPPYAMTMDHPFNPLKSRSLGWMYIIWQLMFQMAVVTTWQTMITRVLSARDSATAKRIYARTAFYFVGRFALPGLWGAAAFLYFCSIGGLPDGATSQTAMPLFLKTVLPAGILGIVIAAMLAAEMSTDSGYLLSWATVIYNDLICPCVRRPLSPTGRLLLVRALVLLIGLFLLLWGLWYEVPGRAWDYLAITGNIYLSSVFTLLVGALYWRKANSVGAMAAIVLGAAAPITFLAYNSIVTVPERQIRPEIAGFAAFALAFAGMIVGSLVAEMLGFARPHSNDTSSPTENS